MRGGHARNIRRRGQWFHRKWYFLHEAQGRKPPSKSFTYYKASGFFCKEMPFPADPVQGSRTKTAAGRDLPASAGTQ